MELDDLKRAWKEAPVKNNLNTDIMNIIQHKSYGPVAALKKVFRKQMVAMSIIPLVLILTNLSDLRAVFTSVMFWTYVAFCIGIIAFARYNYRIACKMERMDGVVKDNLQQQVQVLEKRAKTEIMLLRYVLLFFIALTEILPYFQDYRMLRLWHSMPVLLRFGSYAGLLLLQYFMNRRLKERRVGVHLRYLKSLVGEMQ
ncbi:MAG TPA: hypothetical protein VEB40_02345 [Flavipsychrobacter sp.]|nr:hypothetical protein [Flavipsychrobacter sp.]